MIKILLIDDEKEFREMVAEILEAKGFIVHQKCDGTEGVEAYKNGKYDLVVTDLMMPGQDGIGVIMEIKGINADQKMVAMSGGGNWGGIDYLEMTKDLGVDAIFEKPFSSLKFIAQIKILLNL